jgi:hypothetical protein
MPPACPVEVHVDWASVTSSKGERLQRERPPDKPVASKTKLHRYPLIVHGETRVNSVFTCISLAGDLLDLSLHKNYRFDLIDCCFYDDQFLAGLR